MTSDAGISAATMCLRRAQASVENAANSGIPAWQRNQELRKPRRKAGAREFVIDRWRQFGRLILMRQVSAYVCVFIDPPRHFYRRLSEIRRHGLTGKRRSDADTYIYGGDDRLRLPIAADVDLTPVGKNR